MELLGEAKHVFSHIEWHMLGYRIFSAFFYGPNRKLHGYALLICKAITGDWAFLAQRLPIRGGGIGKGEIQWRTAG